LFVGRAMGATVYLPPDVPSVVLGTRGADQIVTMCPSGVSRGQKILQKACPSDISTRQPSDSAYWMAFSMCLLGCRDLPIRPILGHLLTSVNPMRLDVNPPLSQVADAERDEYDDNLQAFHRLLA
jgi:hypothetical protein